MFLAFRPSNGFRYLYLLEGEKKAGEKYSRSKTHLNLGREDELSPKILDYLRDKLTRKELAKAVVDDFAKGDCDSLFRKVIMGDWEPSSPTTHETEKAKEIAELPFPLLRYGHLAFRKIWENDLNFKYKIDYLQKSKTKITAWSISNLLFYLCTSRIIEPTSYLQAYKHRDEFLYCPWGDIVLDNYYRTLDFLHEYMDDIVKYIVKRKHDNNNTKIDVAFFDCTNTWFETPYDDKTWLTIKYINDVSDEMRKLGNHEDEIDKYLSGDEFAKKLEDYLESKEDEILRMRGPSKEGRYSQPIITVALAIDQSGFPIDFRVFPGNVSEMKTIAPVLNGLKKKYNIKNVYFVADRGLNSAENLLEIQDRKLGYIVAQKITGQKESDEAEMLELNGYKNCRLVNGNYILSENTNDINPEEFRYKVCDRVKSIYVENEDGSLTKSGKVARHKVEIPCKLIYTFCPKRKRHDIEELKTQIKRAKKEIDNGTLMGNPNSSGWRGLIRTEKEKASKDGEDTNMYRAIELKEDIIEKRMKLAGYAAYVFRHPDEANESWQQMTDEQILSTYHKLVDIESCFKTMKSNFSLRPVYVRIYQRLRGHCAVCVFALMLLRALQQKILECGYDMTLDQIISTLKGAFVIPVKTRLRTMLLTAQKNLGMSDTKITGKGKFAASMNALEDADTIWNKYSNEVLNNPSDLGRIFEAAGLGTPAAAQSLPELKTTLKMDTLANDLVLSSVMRKRLEASPTLF